MMKTKPVILFDGVCNFCNDAIDFVIKRDKRARIRFAPLQSVIAMQLMTDHDLKPGSMRSFIFIEKGKTYDRSTAVLKVCRYLGALWPLCYGLIIIPKFIRNAMYDWVARNRYKWFGKKQECMVPTPDVRARFLS